MTRTVEVRACWSGIWEHEGEVESYGLDERQHWPAPVPDFWGVYTRTPGHLGLPLGPLDHQDDYDTLEAAEACAERLRKGGAS